MRLLVSTLLLVAFFSSSAQTITAEQIIDNYLEKIGGKERWRALKATKIIGMTKQGDLDIPMEIMLVSDGRQYTQFVVRGKEYFQQVYDGNNLLKLNFQTFKHEKAANDDLTNFKLDLNDFPDSFLDYDRKGYVVELMGKVMFDGKETYKVKLLKEPRLVDGAYAPDMTYYFFDTQRFLPIGQESTLQSGPDKGKTMRVWQSDFREVDGYVFPHKIEQGTADGTAIATEFLYIVINPRVVDEVFEFSVD